MNPIELLDYIVETYKSGPVRKFHLIATFGSGWAFPFDADALKPLSCVEIEALVRDAAK